MNGPLLRLRSLTLRATRTEAGGVDLHGTDYRDGEDYEYHHTIPADGVVDAVVLLTRPPEVTADDYYSAIRANAVARSVELSDIVHNTDPARTASLTTSEREWFAQKYAHAREMLGA